MAILYSSAFGALPCQPTLFSIKEPPFPLRVLQMIAEGILAPDTYMTANSYAKLKLALNDDLSGIDDLESFAATLNRNCFRGAMNFLITVILRYNPYARIAIVGDYN